MKQTIHIIVTILCCCQFSFAQFDFENDPKFKPFLQRDIKDIDKKFKLEKNADIEFRFWIVPSFEEPDLLILTHKDGGWTARFFDVNMYSNGIDERKLANRNIDSLWKELMENKVLSIANSSDLKDSSGKHPLFAVSDGTLYVFELLSKTRKRYYSYSSPDAYTGYIEEYKLVSKIIRLIYNFFDLHDEDKDELGLNIEKISPLPHSQTGGRTG